MSIPRFLVPLCVLVLASSTPGGGAPPDVLVIVNVADPESVSVGEHYRVARSIPRRNVCRVTAPTDLSTDVATYKRTIEGPVRDHLLREGLEGRIDYVVCARGVPILVRVRGGPVSTAALLMLMDTDLSGRDRPRVPVLQNPYRHGPEAFSHATEVDGRRLFLTTFLTGYTAADAKALVDRAIAAEKALPVSPGFYFQDASGPARGRNPQYPNAVSAMKERGLAASHHPHGGGRVVDRKDVMVWMSGGSYSGLGEKGIASNDYPPGAIVDMLESFGAVPRNFDPDGKPSQVPVTWFVRHGITGIHGAVAEPFAHTFPDTSLPLRYASGFNLAESFHGSLPFLYWMNLVIGDPLCTPFVRRPEVRLVDVSTEAASGAVSLSVATDGEVERIEVFVDGLPAGSVAGKGGSVSIDTLALADGEHEVLFVARGPKPLVTAGWTTGVLVVRNEGIRPLSATVSNGRIRVRLSQAVGAGQSAPIEVVGAAGPLPGEVVGGRDPAEAVFVPKGGIPAGVELTVRTKGEDGASVVFVTPPASLRIEGPATVGAGEPTSFRVVALDAAGEPIEKGERHLEIRSIEPPITLASGEGPTLEKPIALTRAGPVTLEARDRRHGVTARKSLTVRPGALAGFVLQARGAISVGMPFDVHVQAVDRFRNRVDGATGTFQLVAQEDRGSSVRGTLVMEEGSRGQGVIRGIRLSKPGSQALILLDSQRRQVGQTMVRVNASRLAAWLVLGPFPVSGGKLEAAMDKDLLGGEAKVLAARGSVHDGRIWKELKAPKEPVDLSRAVGGKGDGVVYALCWMEMGPIASPLRLTIGHGPPLAVLVNGRRVYRSSGPGPGPGKPTAVATDVPLREGWNRVLVKAARTGRQCAFQLRITDAAGNVRPPLRVQLSPPEGLTRLSISGRVTSGKAGVPGITVRIQGPTPKQVVTDRSGHYAVGGLVPGAYTVEPAAMGLRVEPALRRVTLERENAEGVGFSATDAQRPTVEILLPRDGEKVARWFRVVVRASDNVGVVSARLLVDGKPAGDEVKKAPFEITADMKPFGAGTHEIRVLVRDGAGNEAKSAALTVKVELDTKPPRIRVNRPRRGKTIAGRYMDVDIQVRDDVDVARIELLVDGKRLGKPFEAVRDVDQRVDLRGVAAGNRILTVKATDTSGNTAEVTVPFRKR